MLNASRDDVYSLGFNPYLQAWTVFRHIRIDADKSLYKLVPFSNNHMTPAEALKDALVLKLGAERRASQVV